MLRFLRSGATAVAFEGSAEPACQLVTATHSAPSKAELPGVHGQLPCKVLISSKAPDVGVTSP